MSVNSIDMQMASKEVLSSADGPLSPPEEVPPSELDAAPEFSSPPGLFMPNEVKEVTPEMQQLIDEVSLELTRRAENFAASLENDEFEFEYVPAMLPSGFAPPPGLDFPPGLEDWSGMLSESTTEDKEDGNEMPSHCPKLDGNESSDESTNDDSRSNSKAETTSASASVVSDDEQESNDEVPELPDLSAEALSLKKQEKKKAKKIATAAANSANASTRIVFGDEGAKLAAQAAQAAKAAKWTENGVMAANMAWQPPLDARAYGWHPYYGYVAW